LLKQKIKNKNEETIVDPFLTENLIKKNLDINDNIDEHSFDNLSSEKPQNEVKIDSISNINTNNIDGTLIGTKHITKKTIKRKYTLGRSQIKKTVSVLIKDNKTRKTILMAQKELKRKNINDIKIYLKEHNLIKTGSNAPNDVLRKLYESAMLTGEITNSNVDTLLHNFSKEDKKL
jgi:predicted alternative tryptophan synthase beta-subunit